MLKAVILRIWREHDQAYGAHMVWKQIGGAPGACAKPAAGCGG